MKTSYALMAGAVVVMSLTGVARASAADPAKPLTLRLHLHNHANVARDVVIRAQDEVSGIYRRFGVNTVWVTADSVSQPGSHDPELTVIIKANGRMAEQRPSKTDVMGLAPGSHVEPGRIAFAFFDAVDRFARRYDVDVAVVLGYVMAHEIGHLLLPFGTHSKTGLMRGNWGSPQIRHAVIGQLRFTPEQAELIRRKLSGAAL